MAELKNMKFRIADEVQSERLQNVLFRLGYKWTTGAVQHTKKPHLYTEEDGCILFGSLGEEEFFSQDGYVEQNTGQFIAHFSDVTKTLCEAEEERLSHNADNMKAAAAKLSAQDKPFKGLEEAYDHLNGGLEAPDTPSTPRAVPALPWLDNMGECPVEDGNTRVDVELVSGGQCTDWPAQHFSWGLEGYGTDILKWRYHRAEDYFKQPKTASSFTLSWPAPEAGPQEDITGYTFSKGAACCDNGWYRTVESSEAANKILMDEQEEAAEELRQIDSHYDFTYHLTSEDAIAGSIKIDPYFVSQQWQLGSKDSTGVIFHLLKTLARFGDKNSKEREITALHKSVVRLAQLEGVDLK